MLFTADALHCQKDSFTRAAETDNGLLVQVKQNQPTLHETLARLCAEHRPFDSHEIAAVMAARSIDWSRCSTPAGYRVAAADRLRRPGFAPDLREGHPFRPVAVARGDRLLRLPDPSRRHDPRPRRALSLGY